MLHTHLLFWDQIHFYLYIYLNKDNPNFKELVAADKETLQHKGIIFSLIKNVS